MKHEIISKKVNPFLNREEMIMKVESTITPSAIEVKKLIGGDEELIVIKKIDRNFGKRVFMVDAVVYDDKISKDKVEVVPKKVKKKLEDDKKAAATAAAATVATTSAGASK